jgi:hypothetical protein
MIKKVWLIMVQYIEFRATLVNTELGEAYTWIELRNQVEQNFTTKRLFDEWDKEAVLSLIKPYLDGSGKHEPRDYLEALEIVFEEVRDNDTVIVVEEERMQKVILALIEYLHQERYGIRRKQSSPN